MLSLHELSVSIGGVFVPYVSFVHNMNLILEFLRILLYTPCVLELLLMSINFFFF